MNIKLIELIKEKSTIDLSKVLLTKRR